MEEPQNEAQEEPAIEPISVTVTKVRVVDRWPKRTFFALEHLEPRYHHLMMATARDKDADTVTVTAHNGSATYKLRRDLYAGDGYVVADLVEGDTPARLKQRGQKYKQTGE